MGFLINITLLTTSVCLIVLKGYDQGKAKRQRYGAGIYSTPDPKVAECYANEFTYKGKTYLALVQNRVDMAKTKIVENVHVMANIRGNYYVTCEEDSIRPYGLLIKAKK